MTINLKRGALVGLSAAIVAEGLFAIFWYFTLPPDFDSAHSVSRWWNEWSESHMFHVELAILLFLSIGIIGFVAAAFRPSPKTCPYDET